MNKNYLGFLNEDDDRWEAEMLSLNETGVAPSEYWNMDKLILAFIASRLEGYRNRPLDASCLTSEGLNEILEIAEVMQKASEDFTGKVCFKKSWARLGELLPSLWN